MTAPLRFLAQEIASLEGQSLLRRPPSIEAARREGFVNLCSNDYLGLAATPLEPTDARSGAGASPLVVGAWPQHLAAEQALADWVNLSESLIFSSGYAANVGAISALVGRGDLILSDRLNHASIIDGSRLSGATIRVIPHLDAAAIEAALEAEGSRYRRRLVATESYFSMDGDSPDLAKLRRITERHDAILYVDEAHALGVFGSEGRGRCFEAGVVPDVLVGTLGKSLGLQGAFVGGSADLRLWLWNRARSLVFSTAISPALAAAVPGRVDACRRADAGRARLAEMSTSIRRALGLCTPGGAGSGPIIPWVLGDAPTALEKAEQLRAAGVLVSAIRPPTVPEGTARLRITVSVALSDEQLGKALAALQASVGLATTGLATPEAVLP